MPETPPPKKSAVRKRPGRPATGRNPMVGGRVRQTTIDAMDAWAKAHSKTRSEALGLLIDAGLKHPPKVK
jgi:hypothetical protein